MKNPRVLRHIVAIQYLAAGSPQQLANGEPNTEWVDLLPAVSASIEPLRGRELFAAQEHQADVDVRVRVRYREGIEPTMRVVHEGRVYDIRAVLDAELRHRELELLTKLDPTVRDPEMGVILGELDGSIALE